MSSPWLHLQDPLVASTPSRPGPQVLTLSAHWHVSTASFAWSSPGVSQLGVLDGERHTGARYARPATLFLPLEPGRPLPPLKAQSHTLTPSSSSLHFKTNFCILKHKRADTGPFPIQDKGIWELRTQSPEHFSCWGEGKLPAPEKNPHRNYQPATLSYSPLNKSLGFLFKDLDIIFYLVSLKQNMKEK